MSTATDLGRAGLQGWRSKLADVVAPRVASRTPAREEQVRALVGAVFFALAVVYIVKTVRAAVTQIRDDGA
jgi:hypothetical protein